MSISNPKSLEKLFQYQNWNESAPLVPLKFYDRLEKLDVTVQKPVEHSWYNIDKFGFV